MCFALRIGLFILLLFGLIRSDPAMAQGSSCLAHIDPIRQSQEQACLQFLQQNNCDDVKNSPEFKYHERQCDPRSLTTDQELLVPEQFLWRCFNGLVPLENLFRAAKTQSALRMAILTAADKDVTAKRSLFANVPSEFGTPKIHRHIPRINKITHYRR